MYRVWYCLWFQALSGSLGTCPPQICGDYCKRLHFSLLQLDRNTTSSTYGQWPGCATSRPKDLRVSTWFPMLPFLAQKMLRHHTEMEIPEEGSNLECWSSTWSDILEKLLDSLLTCLNKKLLCDKLLMFWCSLLLQHHLAYPDK